MYTDGETVVRFTAADRHFVQQFGIRQATDMVLDFSANNRLPFLYDTYQLAAFFGLSRRALFYYTKHAEQEYRALSVPKRDGSPRRLYAPSDTLKRLQKHLLRHILAVQPVSVCATAYVPRRTLTDNAAPHVGKAYLLKLDIADFFGSISFEQVYAAAFNTRYFPRQIGVMLTELCCRRGVLPQGAPTSPALSNLVMRPFDDAIDRWCRRRGITYTRYCDDMTFSADRPLVDVCRKVRKMLEDNGFALNEKKTRFVTAANRQSVTGLTVNQKIAVSRGYKRRLRQEIHYALQYGFSDSAARAGYAALSEKPLNYWRRLLGQTRYVLQIEPHNAWFRQAEEQLTQAADDYERPQTADS